MRVRLAVVCAVLAAAVLGGPARRADAFWGKAAAQAKQARGRQAVRALERVGRVMARHLAPGQEVTLVEQGGVTVSLRDAGRRVEVLSGFHMKSYALDERGQLSTADREEVATVMKKSGAGVRDLVRTTRGDLARQRAAARRLRTADPQVDALLAEAAQAGGDERVLHDGKKVTISIRTGGGGPILVVDRLLSSHAIPLVRDGERLVLDPASRDELAELLLAE